MNKIVIKSPAGPASKNSVKRVPRGEAVTVLAQVLSEGHPLDEALRRSAEKLPAQERAWLWDVCSGVLRFRPRLDQAIDSLALKKKPSGRLRRYLLIAAYQMCFQESVTPEKVVDETVEAIKLREGTPPASFANALLRKLLPQREAWRNLSRPSADVTGAELAAYTGLPEWFGKHVEADHGREYLLAFSEATLTRPKTWVRGVRDATLDSLVFKKGELKHSAELQDFSEGMEKVRGFIQGDFFVQDLSSQRAMQEVLTEIGAETLGRTALDLCAAPGGKSFHLADEGWKVTATDISEKRLERVRENEARLKLGVKVKEFAAATEGRERFDLVWVDAPCSGSGIIRRHPDVKFLREEKEMAELRKTQRELLAKAALHVKKEGFLVYSVCSVFGDEGPSPIAEFAEGGKWKLRKEALISPQDLGEPDGFYYAVLQAV